MTGPGRGGGDPQRRILDDIGSDSGFLAYVDISNADLLFLAPGITIAMLVLELVVVATGRFFLGIGLGLVVVGIAGGYVYACPAHRTPFGLLRSFITHHRRDRTMTFTDISATTATDPGTETPSDVRELTRVRAVEPEVAGIRRADETLIGAVRIEPANLALADDDRWDRAARGFGDVLNTLDYPVQIHSSATPVDPDRMTDAYDARRTDPDVQSTPALEGIIDVYRQRRPKEFRKRGTSIREYHAIVPVDVQAVSLTTHKWVRRLKGMPLVGDRLASLLADFLVYRKHNVLIEERQRSILEERRSHLANQLASVEGVAVEPLSTSALVELIESYWSGRRSEYPDEGPSIRTTPVVMPDHDATESRSPPERGTAPPTEAD